MHQNWYDASSHYDQEVTSENDNEVSSFLIGWAAALNAHNNLPDDSLGKS